MNILQLKKKNIYKYRKKYNFKNKKFLEIKFHNHLLADRFDTVKNILFIHIEKRNVLSI